MVNKSVIVFLVVAIIFAVTHYVAMIASLYWYYWWFDVVMHFWGGALIGLGVHALSTFSLLHFKPTIKAVLFTLFIATISWEAFERLAGLYDSSTYILDTTQDIVLGFTGGLLMHFILKRFKTNNND